MATSPRSELRIVSITEFEQSEQNGEWYWHTKAANGEVVGGSMGEGYKELRKAVNGFFAQQGAEAFDPAYSELIKISDTLYRIEKVAA
jgi:uncharacterized protein YegP (UPF0339 family)